jgi:hypothetical protein
LKIHDDGSISFAPERKIIIDCCLSGMVLLIIAVALLIMGIRSVSRDDQIFFISMSVAIFLIVVMGMLERTGGQFRKFSLKYTLSPKGCTIVRKGQILKTIHWSDVQQIIVVHGPCETERPEEAEILAPPQGVYLCLKPPSAFEDDKIMKTMLYRFRLSDSMQDGQPVAAIHLFSNSSEKNAKRSNRSWMNCSI